MTFSSRQATSGWLAVHLSEWCTKSDLVLLGHCKITSHQNVIKISMNSNLKLKFDKIYPFNLESERYGYMFKINCDTCRNVVGCLTYDATQAHPINLLCEQGSYRVPILKPRTTDTQ